jgi:hypothetical protein
MDFNNPALIQAFSHALRDLRRTGNLDPAKNVYSNDIIQFDNTNPDLFQFLDNYITDQGSVNSENIQYAATLYTIMLLDVDLGIFRVLDALLHDITRSEVDIQSAETSKRVFDYLQLRDERATAEERLMFYRQVFNMGEGNVLGDMASNREFNSLWDTLMHEVIRYIRKYEYVDHPENVSRNGIYQSILALQRNLSRAMSGMVKLYIPQMYAHLEDAITLLDSSEIVSQKGQGIYRDVWNVIEQISMEKFNYLPNVASIRSAAFTSREILMDISRFTQASFSDADFRRFVENVEAFIVAQGQLADSPSFDYQSHQRIGSGHPMFDDSYNRYNGSQNGNGNDEFRGQDELAAIEDEWDY